MLFCTAEDHCHFERPKGVEKSKTTDMNKTFINENPAGGTYVSPAVETIEIKSEGVLCQSGQFETWEEEEL